MKCKLRLIVEISLVIATLLTVSPITAQDEEAIEVIQLRYQPYHWLQIYLPAEENRQVPTLFVLGVGSGDESDLVQYFAEQGHTVVLVQTANMIPYETHVRYMFCALAAVYASAEEYGYSTDSIVSVGQSMGGTLAAILAEADVSMVDLQECSYSLPEEYQIDGVISMSGVMDFTDSTGMASFVYDIWPSYLDCDQGDENAAICAVSPMTAIDGDEPPFLLLVGRRDYNVFPRHAERFAAALEEAGVDVELDIIPGLGHDDVILSEEVFQIIETFLARLVEPEAEETETYAPIIDPANFVAGIDNPYFPLTSGTTLIYEGETEDGLEHIEVFVTPETRTILGIACVVVQDTVWVDGELVERTFDWYAQDRDGNVWYMGEDSAEYEDGAVVSTTGSWEAGIDGALPGIIMEAHPQVGDIYRQEYYASEAEDMAEVLSLTESATVPYGDFDNLLMTNEWTPLEPGVAEHKYYAPGIGNILETLAEGDTGRVELVEITVE